MSNKSNQSKNKEDTYAISNNFIINKALTHFPNIN